MGRLVTLDCPVNGFPQPEVTWTLPNGSVLPNRLVSTLPIILKTNADFGNYTCSAKSLDRTIPHFIISVQDAGKSLRFRIIVRLHESFKVKEMIDTSFLIKLGVVYFKPN